MRRRADLRLRRQPRRRGARPALAARSTAGRRWRSSPTASSAASRSAPPTSSGTADFRFTATPEAPETDDLLVIATHFPLISRQRAVQARGLRYAGDLEDVEQHTQALARRTAPTVVLSGHLHVDDVHAEHRTLQLVNPPVVEGEGGASLVTIEPVGVVHREVRALDASVRREHTYRYADGRWSSVDGVCLDVLAPVAVRRHEPVRSPRRRAANQSTVSPPVLPPAPRRRAREQERRPASRRRSPRYLSPSAKIVIRCSRYIRMRKNQIATENAIPISAEMIAAPVPPPGSAQTAKASSRMIPMLRSAVVFTSAQRTGGAPARPTVEPRRRDLRHTAKDNVATGRATIPPWRPRTHGRRTRSRSRACGSTR